jgi:quercetin dioxygenase-like cupin family protein
MRRSERAALRSEWSKATAELLVPGSRRTPYSALLVSIDRGGKTGPLRSRGGHFFAYCTRGKVRVVLQDGVYELSAGDSMVVDRPPAAWENAGRGRAEVLILDLKRS